MSIRSDDARGMPRSLPLVGTNGEPTRILIRDYEHVGRDRAREAGFERNLAKPVSISDLHQLLRADPP